MGYEYLSFLTRKREIKILLLMDMDSPSRKAINSNHIRTSFLASVPKISIEPSQQQKTNAFFFNRFFFF